METGKIKVFSIPFERTLVGTYDIEATSKEEAVRLFEEGEYDCYDGYSNDVYDVNEVYER